jgi:hypothetical protein
VEHGPVTRNASILGGISAPPEPSTAYQRRRRARAPGPPNGSSNDSSGGPSNDSSGGPSNDSTGGRRGSRGEALRAYWVAPQGLIMLAVAGLALAVRLYLLSRPGYLTGITEYDDGVYLGGALSLLSGGVPYRDFAFVQPPGILLLMFPAALIAKASSVTAAMAAARLLTVGASAACVVLAGALVRHRGPLVTLVACGIVAVYPDDIMAAHTLLLEPWMNLLVLSGACVAFRGGRLAPPRWLLYAGLLFGLAVAVKYWAVIPALGLFALCLLAGTRAHAVRFAGGALAGFALPVLPFAAGGPTVFVRSTVLDQASRAGSAVPEPLRLAHLTGLADLLNDAGRLTAGSDAGSLFARGDVTAAATWATGWLPVLTAAVLAAVLVLGLAAYWRGASSGAAPWAVNAPEPLTWYAAGTLCLTLAAVLSYSAFFYHYADFAAPWLAVTAGYAGQALWRGAPPRLHTWRSARRGLAAAAAAFVLVAGFQAWELSGLRASETGADAALIPPGACVVTDEISLAVAANRFTAGAGGCPDVLDALATTLVTDNGMSVQGGAGALSRVPATWKAVFSRARYVWLSSSSGRRIPWTKALTAWFARTFRPLDTRAGDPGEGQVYVRRG